MAGDQPYLERARVILSQALEESCRKLVSAASGSLAGPEETAAKLLQSRRKSGQASGLCREGLKGLLEETGEVRRLKMSAIYDHLSKIAGNLGDAADVAGEILAVEEIKG